MAELINYSTLIHGGFFNSVEELWGDEIAGSKVFQFGVLTTITYTYLQQLPTYYIQGQDEEADSGVFQSLTTQIDSLDIILGNIDDGYQGLFEDVANIVFSNVSNETNADNVGAITFGGTLPSGAETGAPAYAFVPWVDSAGEKQGDVWVDWSNNDPQTSNYTAGNAGFSILLHEIGHALGLEHPWPKTAEEVVPHLSSGELSYKYTIMVDLVPEHQHPDMYYVSGVNEGDYLYSLGLYDIAALQSIYGVNTATRSGDNTGAQAYKIGNGFADDAATPFIYTIWDGGGNDTIDATGYADGVEIDLRDGHFSSIGKNGNPDGSRVAWDSGDYDAGNVAIAFGTVIENATGTAHDDRLIGNEHDNVLDGGAGKDIFKPGGGTDVVWGDADIDTLDLSDVTDAITINESSTNNWSSTSSSGTFYEVERFILGAGNDVININTTSQFGIASFHDGGDGFDTVVIGGDIVLVQTDSVYVEGTRQLVNIEKVVSSSGGHVYVQSFGLAYGGNGVLDYSHFGESLTFNAASGFVTNGIETDICSGVVNFIGTDYGDTYIFSGGASSGGAYLGLGDDIASGIGSSMKFTYSGGNDVLSFGADDVTVIFMERGIAAADVTISEINVVPQGSNVYFDLLVEVEGKGSITIENLYRTAAGSSSTAPRIHFGNGDYYNSFYNFIAANPKDPYFTMHDYKGTPRGDVMDITAIAYHGGHILGYAGDDVFYGDASSIYYWGGEGNDTFYGGTGNEIFAGEFGDDVVEGNEGSDKLYGGVGLDVLRGGDGADYIDGGLDGDILDGNAGNDNLQGGAGDDIYLYAQGDGTDFIMDAGDTDSILFDSSVSPEDLIFLLSGTTVEITFDGQPSDRITLFRQLDLAPVEYVEFGNVRLDLLKYDEWNYGTASGEIINGSVYEDTVISLAGDDAIYAYSGKDTLWGGGGDDILYAGDDDDALYGDIGNDMLKGGSGNDVYVYASGNDVIDEEGSGDVNDVLSFGYGVTEANLTFLRFAATPDDLVIRVKDPANMAVNLGDITIKNQLLDAASQIETLRLFPANDTVLTDKVVYTFGTLGSDTIYGIATGASSDDQIFGLTGGVDGIYAGVGNDTVYGGGGYDYIDGGSGDDILYGGAGNDDLFGQDGIDQLYGEDGNDRMYGGGGNDMLAGGAGDDFLYGGTGADTLYGGEGNDTLYGTSGADVLYGGTGADIFAFESVTAFGAVDTVQGFNIAVDHDVLDISDILDQAGYLHGVDMLENWVQITDFSADSALKIDTTGTGSFGAGIQIATLTGVTGLTDEQALVNSGNLAVV